MRTSETIPQKVVDVGTPSIASAGRAEPEQRDHEDRRHAAEEVGVGDRERADREEDRPGQAAQDGEQQREDEDEDLGDHEDLHVQEEGARDDRERLAVLVPVEERRLDLGPVRSVCDPVDERGEEDERREQREGDGTTGAATPEDLRFPAQLLEDRRAGDLGEPDLLDPLQHARPLHVREGVVHAGNE